MKSILKIFTKTKRSPERKIGILYICTGKYRMFWDEFYKTAEQRFCPNSELHYFVFTEQPVNTYGNPKVNHIPQEKLGWPFDTLMRFHLFLAQREKLEQMDYLFFFNANMKFLETIPEEVVLPDAQDNYLVSVRHYWFFDHSRMPPFDNNPESEAYVEPSLDKKYYQGCLSGGRTKEYLEMSAAIKQMVDKDAAKDYIALWHDESYMNRYLQTTTPKALDPSYAYPEGVESKMKRRILMFDKKRFGGHEYMRK